MPIRLNLLAEVQAAEEQRRKDPVKRAMILGAVCIAVMVVISVVIQLQVIATKRSVGEVAQQIQTITNDFASVVKEEARLRQLNLNIRGLDILASERFLNGSLMHAVQKVHTDSVQLVRLRTEHEYVLTDESRAKTNLTKLLKPATAAEKIQVVIEAVDTSSSPGDQVNKFKEAIAKNEYFQNLLGTNSQMRLVNLSPPQVHPDIGRPVVQFTLESRLPEKVRLDIASPTRYAPASVAKSTTAPKTSQEKSSL